MFVLLQVGIKVYTMAKFLTELSLLEYKLLRFLPSQVAAASLLMAMRLLGKHRTNTPWVSQYTTRLLGQDTIAKSEYGEIVD